MDAGSPNGRDVYGSRSDYHRSSSSTGMRASTSSPGLDQLRRNLQGIHLRESVHRPYYPSPLSQSPLQASISSASQTAASIASSSRTTLTTSTTPPSSSSRFSINQAFKTLTDDDVAFFDQLISTLPPRAADFSQLKAAYTAHLPDELDRRYRKAGPSRGASQVDWDAHLWSILLSLVKVRGNNWRERWDSVRLAFGLDPNSGDETDSSAATRSTNLSSSTQQESDLDSDASSQSPLRALRAAATQEMGPTPRQTRFRENVLPPRDTLGLPRSSSPLSRQNHDHAQSRLSLESEQDRPSDEATPRRRVHISDPISAIQARLNRLLEPDEQEDEARDTGPPDLSPLRQINGQADHPIRSQTASLPTDAKRRFDELVRSSQIERSRLRQSQMQLQEREEEESYSEQLEAADLWRAQRLLHMCLSWWIALTRKQIEKSQNAAAANDHVALVKAWERWRQQTEQNLDGRRVGEKTDRVRCMLTAFRRWKRLATTVVERKEELKKEAMRTAYYTTSSSVKKRLLSHAFRLWNEQYMTRVADKVRRRHLQAGAFALWQMRCSHTQQLKTRERIFIVKRQHSTLTHAWDRWADRTDEAKLVGQFQHHHNRLLALETLHAWRKATMLSKLSQAFAERRLKLAAFDGWKQALEHRRMRRRHEALASRWRTRRFKLSALSLWQRRHRGILEMQEQADQLRTASTEDKLYSTFHRWQVEARARLLEQVRSAGTLQRCFHHWRQRHATLVSSLEQRESVLVQGRSEATVSICLRRWQQRTCQIQEREAEAVARRNDIVCNDYLITWRNRHLHQRLLREKAIAVSDFFTLQSAFHHWRAQQRQRRAESQEALHHRRLVEQVFAIWRTRAAKQRRLENLLQHTLAKKEEALAKSYLDAWVAKIIEVRSRELEVVEEWKRRLMRAAFYAWIEACLRHDDLLALMNSYIDVKQEERKRSAFTHWQTLARENRERRQTTESLQEKARQRLMVKTMETWRDKMRERTLAMEEYEMLMRRQRLSMRWALGVWQGNTRMLPAIRLRNTSLKRIALQTWKTKLPEARAANEAARFERTWKLQQAWRMWRDGWRSKKQLRAAARFGAGSISVQRLRTLSAAATAANRSAGSSSPSVPSSSSPSTTTPKRPKTSLAILPPPYESSAFSQSSAGQPMDSPSTRTRRSAKYEQTAMGAGAADMIHELGTRAHSRRRVQE